MHSEDLAPTIPCALCFCTDTLFDCVCVGHIWAGVWFGELLGVLGLFRGWADEEGGKLGILGNFLQVAPFYVE